jgi:hypothetical protein
MAESKSRPALPSAPRPVARQLTIHDMLVINVSRREYCNLGNPFTWANHPFHMSAPRGWSESDNTYIGKRGIDFTPVDYECVEAPGFPPAS